MSGHRPALADARQGDHQYPLIGRIGSALCAAALVAVAALLLIAPHAHGNFVYWSKQIKKQLRKKRKAKAKANVSVFIHFVPAGIAGVPNTQQVTVVLVKQRTKKKK